MECFLSAYCPSKDSNVTKATILLTSYLVSEAWNIRLICQFPTRRRDFVRGFRWRRNGTLPHSDSPNRLGFAGQRPGRFSLRLRMRSLLARSISEIPPRTLSDVPRKLNAKVSRRKEIFSAGPLRRQIAGSRCSRHAGSFGWRNLPAMAEYNLSCRVAKFRGSADCFPWVLSWDLMRSLPPR
jgi:hypothetical protein